MYLPAYSYTTISLFRKTSRRRPCTFYPPEKKEIREKEIHFFATKAPMKLKNVVANVNLRRKEEYVWYIFDKCRLSLAYQELGSSRKLNMLADNVIPVSGAAEERFLSAVLSR